MKILITTDWYAPVINGVVTSVLLLQRELEERGHVFIIRPQVPVVKNTEDDVSVLTNFYNHGYEYAKDVFPQIAEYLKWEPVKEGTKL